MSKYSFPTEAAKQAAIVVQKANVSEVQAVHDKHLADLENAQVTG